MTGQFTRNCIALSGLFIIGLLLWLPQGFNVGVTGDAWIYTSQSDAGNVIANQLTPDRPFVPFAWAVGYALAPGSFIGINVFVLLLLVGKAAAVYGIVRGLGGNAAFAWAAAALTLVFSADTGIFYLGALAIHLAAFCCFAAIFLFVENRRRPHVLKAIGMLVLLSVTVNIYEVGFPLLALTPLLLLRFQRNINFRFVALTLLWYSVPFVRAVWTVYLLMNTGAFRYQQGRLASDLSVGDVVSAIGTIYTRHLVEAWSPAAQNPTYWLIGAAAGVIAAGITLFLLHRDSMDSVVLPRRWLLWTFIIGLTVIGLGTVLYLITVERVATLRVYFYSAVGAGLAVAAVAWFVGRRVNLRVIFPLIVGVLVTIGAARLLEQRAGYVALSVEMQRLPLATADLLHQIQPNSHVYIIDDSPTREVLTDSLLPSSWWFLNPTMQMLFNDRSINIVYCFPRSVEFWGIDRERCLFDEQTARVQIFNGYGRLSLVPYNRLIVLRYESGTLRVIDDLSAYTSQPAALANYAPRTRFNPDAPLPPRATTLFTWSVE